MVGSGHGGERVLGAAVRGMVAGAVGVWLMDLVSTALYDRESDAAKHQESAAMVNGMDPASVAANRFASAIGIEPSEEQTATTATAIHYALGVLPGALYGVLRNRLGEFGSARGLAYGLVLFLLNDETLGPALGLAAGPTAYPWQAHARGLTSHLVLGVATDAVLDLLD